MNHKLLICGSCLVLGVCFSLGNRLKETTAVISENRAGPVSRSHALARPLSPSVKARSFGDGRRSELIEKIDAILSSCKPTDSERFSSLLIQLVEIDPAAAAEYATALASGPMREEVLRGVSQAWASKEPANAEIWAAGLTAESERQSALENVCLQFAKENAEDAVRTAEKYELGINSKAFLENLAQQWSVQDFPSAAAWIKSQPAGEKREQLIMRLAFVRAATLPAEAGRLVVEEIPDGPVQIEAVISVIYQWASRDMPGASEWVGLFPEGPLRERAESELANIVAYQLQQ